MTDWTPIASAQTVNFGTVADLKMASGRIYRAVFGFRGNICAWWPQNSPRKSPIALYEPEAFRVVATGTHKHDRWNDAFPLQHGAA